MLLLISIINYFMNIINILWCVAWQCLKLMNIINLDKKKTL